MYSKSILSLFFIVFFFSGCSSGTMVGTVEVNVTDSIVLPTNVCDPLNSSDCVGVNSDSMQTIDFYKNIALRNLENITNIHKFGSSTLDTTVHIISVSEMYQTPITPQSLEFVSDSVDDTFLGSGAREITIVGTNSNWEEESIIIQTNGTTPVELPIQFLRIYRWWVSSSGTYASPTTTSYDGNLEIRGLNNGVLWTTILNTPVTTGQSQIGVYTIPKGKSAYLVSKSVFTDTSKSADIYFFFREHADDITVPFNGTRRIIEREVGVSGGFNVIFDIPKGPFVGPADIGMFGSVSQGTAAVSVEFELFLVDSD